MTTMTTMSYDHDHDYHDANDHDYHDDHDHNDQLTQASWRLSDPI